MFSFSHAKYWVMRLKRKSLNCKIYAHPKDVQEYSIKLAVRMTRNFCLYVATEVLTHHISDLFHFSQLNWHAYRNNMDKKNVANVSVCPSVCHAHNILTLLLFCCIKLIFVSNITSYQICKSRKRFLFLFILSFSSFNARCQNEVHQSLAKCHTPSRS